MNNISFNLNQRVQSTMAAPPWVLQLETNVRASVQQGLEAFVPGIMEYVDERLGKQFQQMESVVISTGSTNPSRKQLNIRRRKQVTPNDEYYEGDTEDTPKKSRIRTQQENALHVSLPFLFIACLQLTIFRLDFEITSPKGVF